jgi:hypothetical protein
LGNDTALELKRGVGRIVRVSIVRRTAFVYALWNVGSAKAAHCLHFAEQIVEHIPPVAKHIEDDAATVGLAIIPARALRRLPPVAFEDPIAEFAPHREHAAKETGIAQHPDLAQAGQEQLVLYDPVFHPFRLCEFGNRQCLVQTIGDGFLAIDVFAGSDCPSKQIGAHLRRRRIEKHFVV